MTLMTTLTRQIVRIPDRIIDAYSARLDFNLRSVNFQSQAETQLEPKMSDFTSIAWQISATFGSGQGMPEHAWSSLMAAFRKGGGASGYYTLYDPNYKFPLGAATGHFNGDRTDRAGEPFAAGVVAADGTLAAGIRTAGRIDGNWPLGSKVIRVSGLMASQSKSIAMGDRFSILNVPLQWYPTLHYAESQCESNAQGIATVPIEPGLPYPARHGTIVEFWKPSCIVKLLQEPAFAEVPPNFAIVSANFVSTNDFLRRGIPGTGDLIT